MSIAANLRSHVPESVRSPWYSWFVEAGYPNLDIMKDGESYWKLAEPSGAWHIIEFYRSPVIPSLTPWNYVLKNIRNTEISRSFVEKYVKNLDLRRKEVWDAEAAKTKKMEDEFETLEKHRADTVERAFQAVKKNDGLVERVARNGMHELLPSAIFRHISPHHKRV